ncbi:MAG: NAD-dependent epimerase/dehydratase family protein [Candidatus Levyibacteriota bacterium]|nr:MAG: NAD-dependent epimerase/dehydratase family protein [Candidatus Levybacteria bacterium]
MNSFLITGTSSGLGKYLYANLGGISLNREKIQKNGAEIIIHCAFNSENNPKDSDQYYNDNVLLTKRLTKIPHTKFIFVSSVDVYPKNSNRHTESEIIDMHNVESLYAKTKLLSEDLVKKNCPNFLILRCSALLGKDSRRNSLIKIIEEKKPTLTLSGDSISNYILHEDVLSFIKAASEKDLQGIYNLASSKNITLKQVTDLVKKKVTFGDYVYNVGNIDNSKTVSISKVFKKTSREIITEFVSHNTVNPTS